LPPSEWPLQNVSSANATSSTCWTLFADILMIRTWAVWRRNRYIGILLGFLMIFITIMDFYLVSKFLKSGPSSSSSIAPSCFSRLIYLANDSWSTPILLHWIARVFLARGDSYNESELYCVGGRGWWYVSKSSFMLLSVVQFLKLVVLMMMAVSAYRACEHLSDLLVFLIDEALSDKSGNNHEMTNIVHRDGRCGLLSLVWWT
jgi:hypothetical protein